MINKKTLIIVFTLIQIHSYSNAGDFWGINSKNLSLGGRQVSGVNDYSAAFHNPSKLPFIGLNNGIGYQYSLYKLKINMEDKRSEKNKELFISKSPKKLQNGYSSFTLGFTIPIFKTKSYGLSLGLASNFIEDNISKISIFDEKLYQFYKFHSNVETFLMNLGIGFQFLKNYSIGLGLAQLVSVKGETNVRFKLGNDYDKETNNNSYIISKDLYLTVVNQRAFNFSLSANYNIFSFSAVYKQSLSLPYKIPASIVIKNLTTEDGKQGASIDLLIEGYGFWLPPKLDFGFSLDLSKKINSLIHLNISYELWGKAPEPYSFTSINSDASLILIKNLESLKPSIKYEDSINIYLGYSLNFFQEQRFNLGFSYRPSIIKSHDKLTNIVDNDTISFSTGFELKLLSNKSKNFKDLYLNIAYSIQHALYKSEYSNYYNSSVNYGGNIHLFFIDILYK